MQLQTHPSHCQTAVCTRRTREHDTTLMMHKAPPQERSSRPERPGGGRGRPSAPVSPEARQDPIVSLRRFARHPIRISSRLRTLSCLSTPIARDKHRHAYIAMHISSRVHPQARAPGSARYYSLATATSLFAPPESSRRPRRGRRAARPPSQLVAAAPSSSSSGISSSCASSRFSRSIVTQLDASMRRSR